MNFLLNKANNSLHSSLYIKSDDPKGDINKAKEVIIQEYSQYSKVIKESKIQAVNLVSNLRVKNNADIDKYLNMSETVDPEALWMHIDVGYLDNLEYFRQCINHEIVHLYDHSKYGTFKPDLGEWKNLNPKNFEYGAGGWVGYHTKFENSFHPALGFITSYATLGIDEDRAELFMYYFTDHLRPRLNEALSTDEVLRKKLNLLLEEIS